MRLPLFLVRWHFRCNSHFIAWLCGPWRGTKRHHSLHTHSSNTHPKPNIEQIQALRGALLMTVVLQLRQTTRHRSFPACSPITCSLLALASIMSKWRSDGMGSQSCNLGANYAAVWQVNVLANKHFIVHIRMAICVGHKSKTKTEL